MAIAFRKETPICQPVGEPRVDSNSLRDEFEHVRCYLELRALVLARTGLGRRLGLLGPGGLMNPRLHLYNFSTTSLALLLSKHGFETRKFLSFDGGMSGSSRKDLLQRAYSLFARLAKMLSAGRVDISHSFGVIAIRRS